MKRLIPITIALVACALAGCGSSKSTSTPTTSTSATTTSTTAAKTSTTAAKTSTAPMKMTPAQMRQMAKPGGVTGTTGSAVAAHPSGALLALSAAANGNLMYDQSTLVAKAGTVTIDFTNQSPIGHNVTVANAAGKVLGATPTFTGGTRTLKLTLTPGKYTYYCSVPGHEQAGMKGTLTVT